MYGAHDAVQQCRFCHGRKDDLQISKTCQASKDGQHYWEVELHPRRGMRSGWWLMLLFTWDLLLGKLDKDEL
jgi:hypothetical protein